MKVLNLFPSSIIQDKILINQEVKEGMIKEIETMVSKSKNKDDIGKHDSWTGDTQGFEYIFKNEKFSFLLQEVKKIIIAGIDVQCYIIHVEKEKLTLPIPINQQWRLRPVASINQINK